MNSPALSASPLWQRSIHARGDDYQFACLLGERELLRSEIANLGRMLDRLEQSPPRLATVELVQALDAIATFVRSAHRSLGMVLAEAPGVVQ